MFLNRSLHIPDSSRHSFFLWGPRQSGKTSLLSKLFPNAYKIDLLNTDRFVELTNAPYILRQELTALESKPDLVIIDEVQKVPVLLDEVHWLIENHKIRFGLCGSSARKLKRGHGNMLGGRAIRYELCPLTAFEIGKEFDFERAFNHGLLPAIYLEENPTSLLRSYVSNYLKEEILAKGVVRSLPSFSRFLEVAALTDTQIVNFSKIAEDCQVSPPTVKGFFEILVDTLLGSFLDAYTKKAKRKVVYSPKFYLFDVGISSFLAKRGKVQFGSDSSGPAMENWLYHEIKAFNLYSEKHQKISYWRLSDHAATEVDFIIGDMEIAIECKASSRIVGHHLKSLYEVKREYPKLSRRIIVCMEARRRTLDDKIEIIPAKEFVRDLWTGRIF